MLWTQHLIVDLPLFNLALFLRLPPFLSFGDCFRLPIVCEILPVSLCFLSCSVLIPWVYSVKSVVEYLWDSGSPWSPDLTDLGLWFMLALCMSLVFGCCWVFLWWIFPTLWLSEGQSVPYLFSSVVHVWAGCVGAGSSMFTRFWGFSLALVQLFVLSNFSTT